MANFEIPENPEYKEQLRKLEPTDPAHADLFNELFQVLLINQAFLKKIAEEYAGDIEKIETTLSSHAHDERYYTENESNNLFVKKSNISSSSAITETGTYALDAREKNAALPGTLANTIESLHTNLKKILVVEKVQSPDKMIAANEGITLTATANKSGYTPIGIVGFDCDGSGESNCRVYATWLSGATCAMSVRNAHQSLSATVHAFFYVLYVKNDL